MCVAITTGPNTCGGGIHQLKEPTRSVTVEGCRHEAPLSVVRGSTIDGVNGHGRQPGYCAWSRRRAKPEVNITWCLREGSHLGSSK